ncbi:MAG: RsiV family protein [Eubacterium sp.]
MNRKEAFEQLKREYKNVEIPQEGKERMQIAIEKAKADKVMFSHRKNMYKWLIATAAMLVLLILPNTNETIADSMQNIPVIGNLFKVITLREYNYDDGHNSMSVKVPKIENESNINLDSVEQINAEVKEYEDKLIAQFKKDITKSGYNGLNVSYKKITDTEKWFTLEFDVTETKASGYEFRRYYHVNKTTGKIVTLQDLFQKDSDYVTVISDEIKRQMQEQMRGGEGVYFIEDNGISDGFKRIKKNQNFYFDDRGNLVIVFDEYVVAPGSMGITEFKISPNIISSILK